MKSKILKIRNLPTDGKLLDRVTSKPYLFIVFFIVVGVIFLFTPFYLLGIVLCILFLYNLLFVKNITLIEFYDAYVFFYLNNGKDECFVLFWEDILKWNYTQHRNRLDLLQIHLKNNESITMKCLSRKKILKYFHKYGDLKDEDLLDDEVSKQRSL